MMSDQITFGSVCSGIEAASMAWLPIGWHCAFMSEIEPAPRAVLAHHYPETHLHGDFTTIQRGDYADIDVLVGGTPCQSFSVAGLRGGMADARGNLALEYLRLADRLRPDWLVWENVPGVLSSNGGRDFGSFLGGLVQLGYGFAYRVLDAQFFGLAQRRKRVFVVGYLGDWRRAAAVLFEPASLRGDTPPRRKARKDVAPTLSSRPTGGGGLGTDFDLDGGLIAQIAGTLCNNGKAAGSATSQDAANGFLVAHTLRGDGFDASEDGTGRGTPIVPCEPYTLAIRGRDGGHDLEWRQDGTANALLTSNGGRAGIGVGAIAIGFQANASFTNGNGIEISPTLGSHNEMAVAMQHLNSHTNGGDHQAALIRSAVRRMTPRECERLQGAPDDYTRIPVRFYKNRRITKLRPADMWERVDGGWMLMASDGPRYKQIGNSMAKNVMAWIGQRIEKQHRQGGL